MDLFDNKLYVGIVGSRRRDGFDDYAVISDALVKLVARHDTPIVIVSGGCRQGGDRFAKILSDKFRMEITEHLPDKNSFRQLPQPWRATRQNYERNTLIARDARDYLIACVSLDRTGGTEDTIKKWIKFHRKEPIIV